jgi:hypothetical protein
MKENSDKPKGAKVVNFRVPFETYIEWLKDAQSKKLSMTEYLYMRLYDVDKGSGSSDVVCLSRRELVSGDRINEQVFRRFIEKLFLNRNHLDSMYIALGNIK